MKQMFKKLAVGSMLSLCFVANANSTLYTTTFNNITSLNATASGFFTVAASSTAGNFASLSFDSNTNQFVLNVGDLNTFFTNTNLSVRGIALDLGSTTTYPLTNISTINETGAGGAVLSTGNTNGLPTFTGLNNNTNTVLSPLNATTQAFNVNFDITGGAFVTNTESLTFNLGAVTNANGLQGFNPNCLTSSTCAVNSNSLSAFNFALLVSNGTDNAGNNRSNAAWLRGAVIDKVSAVPEPESYVMFMAGLGLLGFVSRRSSKQV